MEDVLRHRVPPDLARHIVELAAATCLQAAVRRLLPRCECEDRPFLGRPHVLAAAHSGSPRAKMLMIASILSSRGGVLSPQSDMLELYGCETCMSLLSRHRAVTSLDVCNTLQGFESWRTLCQMVAGGLLRSKKWVTLWELASVNSSESTMALTLERMLHQVAKQSCQRSAFSPQ